jgi:ribonuclease Z
MLFGPPGLESVVRSLCVICPELPFRLRFNELPYDGIADIEIPGTDYRIDALAVDHTRTTFAYNVRVERAGKFDLARAEKLGLPKKYWNRLQAGEPVEFEGKAFTPDMVLGERRRGIKVSYCTDSRPTAKLPGFVKGADLFVCEGLYGDPLKKEKAASHGHMIYKDAARIAAEGGVEALWLTHFSPAMPSPKEFLKNARDVFPAAETGKDGKTALLLFKD